MVSTLPVAPQPAKQGSSGRSVRRIQRRICSLYSTLLCQRRLRFVRRRSAPGSCPLARAKAGDCLVEGGRGGAMHICDFEVLRDGAVIAARLSPVLPNIRAAWPKIAELARR